MEASAPIAEPTPAHDELVISPDEPVPSGFEELGLSEPIYRAVAEKGYLTPTPIQAAAIPAVLPAATFSAAPRPAPARPPASPSRCSTSSPAAAPAPACRAA